MDRLTDSEVTDTFRLKSGLTPCKSLPLSMCLAHADRFVVRSTKVNKGEAKPELYDQYGLPTIKNT